MTLLPNSLAVSHEAGLRWFADALISSYCGNREVFVEIAQQVSPFVGLESYDDPQLLTRNRDVSVVLRLAQFYVASGLGRTDRLPKIAERLLIEARSLEEAELADGMVVICVRDCLLERDLRLAPKVWVDLIEEFAELTTKDTRIGDLARNLELTSQEVQGWTLRQFLFVCRATNLHDIGQLEQLFDELDRLEEAKRNEMLAAFGGSGITASLILNNPWVAEFTKDSIDGVLALEKYKKLEERAIAWNHHDIALEAVCIRSVLLDEFLGQPAEALQVLDVADELYDRNYRLLRQRQKVLAHTGEHEAALRILEIIAEEFPEDERVEKSYAFRDAAISASILGQLEKSTELFLSAWESASECEDNMWPMSAGLLADASITAFKRGEHGEAVCLMIRALKEAERIDPQRGLKEKYLTIILGHSILWMQSQTDAESNDQEWVVYPGICSNPAPDARIGEKVDPPPLLRWYKLAEIECDLNLDCGALDALRIRTKSSGMVSSEIELLEHLMRRAIRTSDAQLFVDTLPAHIMGAREKRESGVEQIVSLDVTVGLPDIDGTIWDEELRSGLPKDILLAFISTALAKSRRDSIADLSERIRDSLLMHKLGDFLPGSLALSSHVRDIYSVTAHHLANLVGPQASVDELFVAGCYLCNWLQGSDYRKPVETELATYMGYRWREVIEHRRAMLVNPRENVSIIDDAIRTPTVGLAKLALISLAASGAFARQLPAEMRDMLRALAQS